MDSRSKYLRTIHSADPDIPCGVVDVYSVLDAFAVTCPARQHATKKLLCAGLRGKGDALQDLREALVAVERAIALEVQRQQVIPFSDSPFMEGESAAAEAFKEERAAIEKTEGTFMEKALKKTAERIQEEVAEAVAARPGICTQCGSLRDVIRDTGVCHACAKLGSL